MVRKLEHVVILISTNIDARKIAKNIQNIQYVKRISTVTDYMTKSVTSYILVSDHR